MPRKKNKAKGPRVATGEGVSLPTAATIATHSVGVSSVRRRPPQDERMVRARRAGAESALFPHGGEAFERFCGTKGIDPRKRRPASEWVSLLDEFNNRPIHGHRRGAVGGSHRSNARSITRR
jgi:hypothetical protein